MEGQHNKTISDLRKFHLMADLPDEVLQWLLDHGEYEVYEADHLISDVGQPIEHMFFLFSGEYIFYMEANGRVVSTVSFKADDKFGQIGGLLPYSKMKTSPGRAFTGERSEVLLLHKKYFHELEMVSPELVERLVDILKERIRYFTSLDNQRDKMSALGKLSAGLAHELNNPSAAIVRNAKELNTHVIELPDLLFNIIKSGVSPAILQSAIDLILKKNKEKKYKSLLEKQKVEDEFNDWMEEKKVSNSWMISEAFAEAGLSIDELEKLTSITVDGQLEPTLKFAATIMTMQNLINETCNASEHISRLVTAVKAFSHMDRGASKQYFNVFPGIQNTLTLLNHKIKKKNIQVKLEPQQEIPKINGLEGELNQVWSNLIDNAIDALEKDGELRIKVFSDLKFLYVEVCDNGKGIPADIQKNIFDPFFTTKPIGEGTGLGLDVVKRILTSHDGIITVRSEPGSTVFTVKLPIHPFTSRSENETADHISS